MMLWNQNITFDMVHFRKDYNPLKVITWKLFIALYSQRYS